MKIIPETRIYSKNNI